MSGAFARTSSEHQVQGPARLLRHMGKRIYQFHKHQPPTSKKSNMTDTTFATDKQSKITAPGTWHVEQDGARKGPFTTEQVLAMIDAKQITRDSMSWKPGDAAWTPLAATSFAEHFNLEPPPLPGAAVPNGLVWVLAFAPLIGQFLAGLFAGVAQSSIDAFWWVTLALNVALSLMDERKLKAAGHDTKRMGGAWLVPVYLYKRSRVLKHNLAYFIVWVLCFIAILVA